MNEMCLLFLVRSPEPSFGVYLTGHPLYVEIENEYLVRTIIWKGMWIGSNTSDLFFPIISNAWISLLFYANKLHCTMR